MANNANLSTLNRQLQDLKDDLELQEAILEQANSSVPPDNEARQIAQQQIAFLNNEINVTQRAINEINFENTTFVEPGAVATVESGPPTTAPFFPTYDIVETTDGLWQIIDNDTGQAVDNFFDFQEAFQYAQTNDLDIRNVPSGVTAPANTAFLPTEAESNAIAAQSATDQLRQQAAVREVRNANSVDWRVKLSLAPGANYLYNVPGGPDAAGLLAPLRATQGVIFPYTPRVDTIYSANYSQMDLTHANYRQYYYKGSNVQEVLLTADFTAQDTKEADYLLAVIHFLKSATKMFYGQDPNRGAPPPVVFLSGFGAYQYNLHPCVISQFNYNLPDDVDYIRARSFQIDGNSGSLQYRKELSISAVPNYSLESIWARLTGANLKQGAEGFDPNAFTGSQLQTYNDATYVPTQMTMTITLLPVVSREQVSKQFSLRDYANGKLMQRGFW